MAEYLERLPQGPVTRPLPPSLRHRLSSGGLSERGGDLFGVLDFAEDSLAPYPTGNGHPAFFAWINSPPSPAGVIAELLATAINATCGMGEHALMDLERGVIADLAGLAGMAESTGGVLTSGGSMANLLCLAAARHWYLTEHHAADGPEYDAAHARLVAYCGEQAHMSVAKAAAVIGIPRSRVRVIPTTPDRCMDVTALADAVRADRAAGLLPFCVVSNLGSTPTGAVDTPAAINAVCRAHGMWHHADGAWGGLGARVPRWADAYRGMTEIDSLTVDPHKTLSVPVGCGAALVTDPDRLRAAFGFRASYLDSDEHLPWMSEYTFELTRPGTRALALWATLHQLGRAGVTALLEHYDRMADYLRERIETHPRLELLACGPLPVVCFRVTGVASHTALATAVQARGRAYLATVDHDGETVLRACICNHRTETAHIDTLIDEILTAAAQLD
ncbi:pyridoxal phosphate-dependent decarboxylase family protein [Nocardia seriolae]|uniref:pyridoxal phosphate-dependent decarboxylase family protein n=1 Tax=Nocardia seriolae TaxID=37332 RepID=UPI001BAB7E9F|nr:aminotransferase class V-fold PLP-dependent enzyme [Nocardia seriolae]QUN16756.1 aminotransferase class V-fold PLP-dependent enzyme [Nocardia seriolae]WKY55375.1 aminotransferase class V-fold PLP-dependent enzyme [Nocardia seriolae]